MSPIGTTERWEARCDRCGRGHRPTAESSSRHALLTHLERFGWRVLGHVVLCPDCREEPSWKIRTLIVRTACDLCPTATGPRWWAEDHVCIELAGHPYDHHCLCGQNWGLR